MEAGSRICRENAAAESDGRIEGGSRQRNETEEQTEESGLGSEELLDVKQRDPSLGFSTIIFRSNLMPVVSVTSIFAGFFISKKT